jgi:hypothetical protein
MTKGIDRDETDDLTRTPGTEIGRRETLRLAALAAALGAGLSVSLHVDEASAEGSQLQFKFYRAQQKGDPQLVYATLLPDEISRKLLEAPGLVQLKCYGQKDSLVGASQMQFKVEQAKQSTPSAPPVTGWDVKQNKKT